MFVLFDGVAKLGDPSRVVPFSVRFTSAFARHCYAYRILHSPVFEVPDESDNTVRFQNTSELLRSGFVIGAPVECLM